MCNGTHTEPGSSCPELSVVRKLYGLVLVATVFYMLLGARQASAEEKFRASIIPDICQVQEHLSSSFHSSINLWTATYSKSASLDSSWHSSGNWEKLGLWRQIKQSQTHYLEPSVALLRQKPPVHRSYSYDSWGIFQAGFGQLFADNVITHYQTNGAGIEEPHWFYLKMNFRF
jgi:hypothetical protein